VWFDLFETKQAESQNFYFFESTFNLEKEFWVVVFDNLKS